MDNYKEIKHIPVYPMCELNNGIILQFMAYNNAEQTEEIWRVFNNKFVKFIYDNVSNFWMNDDRDVLEDVYRVRDM